MSQFSFNFTGERDYAVSPSYQAQQRVNKPTPKMKQYYVDLCVQRRIQPKNYEAMTFEELQAEIQATINYYPASQKQIETIQTKITNLQTMGCHIEMPSAEQFNKLTGGQNGTASSLIASLIEMEKKYADVAPPTDPQLQFMVNMYLCPDIPFEDFNISRRIDLADGLWRRPTPDEFAEMIKANMKRNQASKFIDDFRGVFHTWKSTRIRPEQKKYIRQLEERMVNLGAPTVVNWAVDGNGNLIQVENKVVDKGTQYNPAGYVPLDDFQLDMFSADEASKYIDQLKSESGDKSITRYGEVSDGSQTFEEIRTADGNEFKELQDLMFKLEAVAGYKDEELHNAVTSLLVEGNFDDERLKENKQKIHDFMLDLIERDYIDFGGMAELCKKSEFAIKILLGR